MSGRSIFRFLYGKINSKPVSGMPSTDVMEKLESRAVQAEKLIVFLQKEVAELQKFVQTQKTGGINTKQYEDIKLENQKLRKEIDEWKERLIKAEQKLDIVQVDVDLSKRQNNTIMEKLEAIPAPKSGSPDKEVAKPAKKEKAKSKTDEKPAAEEPPVDVGRLDLRVGKIVSVKKHPDADSLYVEQIDIGEGKLRTVVSGLVKFVPIEEMENRMVVLLCNLKPAKMRGVSSEAMVLCASTPEKVEVLIPPKDALPGDRVFVEGYSQEPDTVLNPKKKIFETVAVDLKTDENKNATYKGVPFKIPGKGVVTTDSLVNVNIK